MKTAITRADQDIARLDVKLAERLGEPVDPRVKAIAELDRSTLPWERHRPAAVPPPHAEVTQQTMTHEQRKMLWMHQAMLTHLLTRPDEVIELAQDNIRRWSSMHRPDGKTVEYLREWESVLDQGIGAVVEAVLSTSPRACELRQNSPFAGVLDQTERSQALQTFHRAHTASA